MIACGYVNNFQAGNLPICLSTIYTPFLTLIVNSYLLSDSSFAYL